MIDADNVHARHLPEILGLLESEFVPDIARAYGNWDKPHLRAWKETGQQQQIELVQVDDPIKRKSLTDMRMAMELGIIWAEMRVQGYAIVTSDSDFISVVRDYIRENPGAIKLPIKS